MLSNHGNTAHTDEYNTGTIDWRRKTNKFLMAQHQWHLTCFYPLMSELQWHNCRKNMRPKGQNHRKHCAHWCINLLFIYFMMSAYYKSQRHTGFKHLRPNESKSHQYVRITMAQLQKEDASKKPKPQKTSGTACPDGTVLASNSRTQRGR